MKIREIARKRLVRIAALSVLALLALTIALMVLFFIWLLYFFKPSFSFQAMPLSSDEIFRKELVETIPELRWTPNGTDIVFTFTDRGRTFHNRSSDRLERRLYVLASDGSEFLPITSRNEIVSSPTISPDSSRVAYLTDLEGYRIEMSSLDGSDKRRFTNEAQRAVSPVWSPDGERIAFAGVVSRRVFLLFTHNSEGIYTVSVDGLDISKIVNAGTEEDGVGYLGGLAWSPDGQRLAFWGRNDGVHTVGQAAVYTVKVDGSELIPLYSTSVRPPWTAITHAPRPTDVSFLAWSPDGQSIAFLRSDDGQPKLYTVGLDGSDPRVIASPNVEHPTSHWTPGSISWSPDGSRILFSLGSPSEEVGVFEAEYTDSWGYYPPAIGDLYIVNADGSDLRAIGPGGIYSTWSPDGSRIANVIPAQYEAVLYTMDPDGSDVRVLVRRADDGELEAVGPDERPSVDVASCSDGAVVADPEANPGLARDCEALAEMIGRIAVTGLNWDADTPLSRWDGVTLGDPTLEGPSAKSSLSELRVRGLSLPERGLTGTFPISVTQLTALRTLDLSYNRLSGAIPPELGNLSALETLNLGDNYLSGPIPAELGNLSALETLNLGDNDLLSPIPPEIGNLLKLKRLNLEFNYNLSGCIPLYHQLDLAIDLTGGVTVCDQ